MTKNLVVFFNPIIVILKRNHVQTKGQSPVKDRFAYRSKLRSTLIQTSILNGCIDEHHIIPQQYKDHVVLKKVEYNIDFSYNIEMMANSKFRKHWAFECFPDILIHEGGHAKYNKYVKQNLDEIDGFECEEDIKFRFWLFHMHLKQSIDNNCEDIPWN